MAIPMSAGGRELSDETLRTLLDIAPDAIAILRGLTVMYMSPTGARMLGHDVPGDVIGMSIGDFVHPDDRRLAGERIAEVMRSGRAMEMPQIYRASRRNGEPFLAEVASVPIT